MMNRRAPFLVWRRRALRRAEGDLHQLAALVASAIALTPFTGACQRGAAPAEAPSAPAPPPPAPPVPTYTGPVVEVPAGSRMLLRLEDNVESRGSAGLRFRATLEAALSDATGKVVVPAGTKVLGIIVDSQSAGYLVGGSELEIAFTDLQIDGMLFPIRSQGVKATGERSGRDTARKVAAGALIGGAFGGGKGAGQGAAIGGAAALITRGKNIRLPSGTMLELTLAAPAKVPAPADVAPATPATAAPASEDAQKECVKKLMASGFTADEALGSCQTKK